MGLRPFSTSVPGPSEQSTLARLTEDPGSLGHLPQTRPTETTHPRHYHKQTYQDLETNTSPRSRHSRGSSDRRGGYGQIIAADGYEDRSQDRQSTRPIRSHPSRKSRRPPSLERQDAFADTRTLKDCYIKTRDLVNSGRTLRVRHQLKGVCTHGLVVINGILMLQEEAMLPRWLDLWATQHLGKRRRVGPPGDYAKGCDVKRRKRDGVRNGGFPEQSSGFWSTCDTAKNST